MHEREFEADKFQEWLARKGAEMLEPTNEWEVLRFRFEDRVSIVYRNNKGRITKCGASDQLYREMLSPPGGIEPTRRQPRMSSRTVQLYTDAGFHIETRSGSWAAILISDKPKMKISGPLKGDISSSTSAELRAIANGLHYFLGKDGIWPGDEVAIVCDNKAAVSRVNGMTRGLAKAKKAEMREAVEAIVKIANENDLMLNAEWIKGHQRVSAIQVDHRVAFNRECDRLCSKHAREVFLKRRAESAAGEID